ncbi:MAG: UDP-N-acetylmuramoyl-tripeptide--D-alanyl-D-alanine ligase [Candidatus Omnitrophota bacterium]|nr:UDP-N-acetylmuramoyl-tripeptide--D-alanyl-D-alanine ligase [Candidatus Omnitrophota bacterium]
MFRVNELIEATKGALINQARNTVIRGISIDSRTIHPQDAFIAIKGNNFDGHDFIDEAIKKGASCIIVHSSEFIVHSKKKVSIIKVNDTTKALGDIARFQRIKFNIPVIAVTGSNGKTTTKEMIAHILSRKFKVLKSEGTKNNQIGLPLTLLKLDGSCDIAVLEVGTNHFGEVEYLTKICQPNIGIITNIGPSHLEYLGNLGGVLREKYALIKNLKEPRIAILNADDSLLRKQVVRKIKDPVILGFGIKHKSDLFATDIKILNGKIEFRVNQKYKFTPLDRRSKISKDDRHLTGFRLNTPGYYNIYNALAAITVARILGLAYKDIILKLNTFDFPQGRLKFRELNSVKFIDDTYNANPISLRQALNVLANCRTAGRKIFVMGDMSELGSYKKSFHCQAGREAARCCDVFITVGNLSKLAAQAAKAYRFDSRNIFTCRTINQARNILFNRLSLKNDDLVLVKGSRSMKMEEIFKN